tara:strand:+ start:3176 stop:3364 length:189 start_codon:yes stop_codon:yes gene_type:complete
MKVVYSKLTGEVVRFFSDFWDVGKWAREIMTTRGAVSLYEVGDAHGWRKIWYLWRYPHIKIR